MIDSPGAPVHGDRGEPATRPVAPAAVTIAISRESGARGGSIARRVGKRLGWQVYTQELLEYLCANEAAREPLLTGVPADSAAWIDSQLDRVALDRGIDPRTEGGVMPHLILTLAARGEVILLGRGAGYYLPRESSLHVRVVAPLSDRIAHMADWSRLTHTVAADLVRQLDERRADFLHKHFGRRTTDPYDFDLILNSGLLREETCADAIVAALNGRQDQLEGDSRLG
jgi:cytidylate kinase